MAQDAAKTLAPSRVYVYIAPVGTAAPADASVALNASWKEVGHTTPDSLSFSTEPEFEEIKSAQSDYTIRRFLTDEQANLSVDLLEWSGSNLKSVYGGGTVTTVSAGQYKFVPPTASARTEVAAIVEVRDGTKVYRYVFPKVLQVEGVEVELQKAQQATLPLRLAVIGSDGVDPWYLLTNDAAAVA